MSKDAHVALHANTALKAASMETVEPFGAFDDEWQVGTAFEISTVCTVDSFAVGTCTR